MHLNCQGVLIDVESGCIDGCQSQIEAALQNKFVQEVYPYHLSSQLYCAN